MSTKSNKKECDRCEDEYESYIVFIPDNFSDITEYLRNQEFENLCKPCRAYINPRWGFAGADKVEPKKEV